MPETGETMTYRRLPKDFPALLRAEGLSVNVLSDWHSRGRPASSGSFDPRGVLNHHTGGSANGYAYARWMFVVGRSDLPAPLCQISIDRQGVVYVGASGRANHGGKAKAAGTVAAGDANSLYAGIEWQLTGTEPIPAKMYTAAVKTNAVLLRIFGTGPETVHCHYETSVTGKWDIGDPNGIPFKGAKVLDVKKFQEAVRTYLLSGKTPAPSPTPSPTPPPAPDKMDPKSYFLGARGDHVTWLGKRLVAHKFTKNHDGDGYQPGPRFTEFDRRNVRDFQLAQGWKGSDADGFPGSETLKKLAARPKAGTTPATSPVPVLPPKAMDPRAYFLGAEGSHVTWLGQRLVKHGWTGYKTGPGPLFSTTDRMAVTWFQRKQGWKGADADGYPGNETLKRLAAAPKAVSTPPSAPVPPGKNMVVKIQHTSLQFSDSPAQQRADVKKLFSRGKDILTWTEAGEKEPMNQYLREIGPLYGYQVFAHKFGTGVAVKKSFGTVTRTGFWQAMDVARSGDPDKHYPRGVAWVNINAGDEELTVGAIHYLTTSRKSTAAYRRARNIAYSKVVGRLAKTFGLGRKIVFVAGDMNMIDKTTDVFFDQPFTTCWDETRQWPDTGHGNIDVIASLNWDGRVKCLDANVLNDSKVKMNSDHFVLDAVYEIS